MPCSILEGRTNTPGRSRRLDFFGFVRIAVQEGGSKIRPYAIDWEGRRYKVERLGFYHSCRKGTRKIHVFSVSTNALVMRLEVDSETLECFLTEVSDGLAD